MRTGKRPRAAAGQMNRRVTVLGTARVDDGGGGYTEAPLELVTVWAAIDPLDGREQIAAMQTGMHRPHRFTMRWRSDIIGASGLLYEGRTFDVQSVVDPEDRHAVLVILADEITPGVAV